MDRAWYLAGWGYVAIAATLILRASRPESLPALLLEPATPAFIAGTDASAWFQSIKPSCNALEVELALRQHPPPPGWDGAAYAAACWAVAGRPDRARSILLDQPAEHRYNAAGVVFGVGHPIADAGDDRSAGPIMQLVVEFQPNNYMALYHAGMSYYAVGQPALARRHLEEFLRQYEMEDGWRSNAIEVLQRLDKGAEP